MMKPTETDYSDVDFTNLVEGQYKIKVDVEYTASTTVPQTNKGEDVKELEKYIIPEGLTSTEISFDEISPFARAEALASNSFTLIVNLFKRSINFNSGFS